MARATTATKNGFLSIFLPPYICSEVRYLAIFRERQSAP
jgi:hypothetical protein